MTMPVYIQHHGRPRFVLTSLELMERLIASGSEGRAVPSSIEALLDLIDSILLVTDEHLCIIGLSGPARHHFASTDWHGKKLVDLIPIELRPVVMRAVNHVRSSGVADSIQLRLGEYAQRTLEVTIRPFDGGVCIIGHDQSAGKSRLEAGALSDAVRQTLNILGTVAVVRVNLRGFILRASESFEMISGLTSEAYSRVRMHSLFDVGSRVAVSDALEKTIDRIEPQRVAARLVTNRGEAIAVDVAFSAEMLRVSIDAIIATIVCIAGTVPPAADGRTA